MGGQLSGSDISRFLKNYSLRETEMLAKVGKQLLEGEYVLAACQNAGYPGMQDEVSGLLRGIGKQAKLDILPNASGGRVWLSRDDRARKLLKLLCDTFDKVGELVDNAIPPVISNRPVVRIGTISSVANYLTPALLTRLQKSGQPSESWPPSIAFVKGGSYQEDFANLLNGKIDLAIVPEWADKTLGIKRIPINYRTQEEGLVFRVGDFPGKPQSLQVFEELLASGISQSELNRRVSECPLVLLSWLDYGTGYHITNNLEVFLAHSVREESRPGERIYVPTSLVARMMTKRGVGISVGHRPTDEPTSKQGIGRNLVSEIREHGGTVGVDPDFPMAVLAYLPFSSMGQKAPISKPYNYIIAVRADADEDHRRSAAYPPLVSSAVTEVVQSIQSIASDYGNSYGYLQFAESDKFLLHDFHWFGQNRLSS